MVDLPGGRSSKTDLGGKTLFNIDAFIVSCMNERVILRHEKHSVFSNIEICPEMHVIGNGQFDKTSPSLDGDLLVLT